MLYNGNKGWVTSFSGTKCRIQDVNGENIKKYENSELVPVTEVTFLHHNSNWLIGPKMELPRL